MRALSVVKRQRTGAAGCCACQAARTSRSRPIDSIRWSRAWRARTESWISAMLSQLPCFGGFERLVERSRRVSIEVVQDEHDLFRVWVLDVGQAPEKVSEIDSSAMLGALGDDATFEGLDGEEDVRRPRAPILVIDSSGPARR